MTKDPNIDELWRKILEVRDLAYDLKCDVLVHLADMAAVELAEAEKGATTKPNQAPAHRKSKC